jgi:hypothetical protein
LQDYARLLLSFTTTNKNGSPCFFSPQKGNRAPGLANEQRKVFGPATFATGVAAPDALVEVG